MGSLGAFFEIEEVGTGRFLQTIHIRPICYRGDDGYYRRIAPDWSNGDGDRPHLITAAPLMVSVAADGMRRLHPTREPDRFVEFGAPYIKPGGQWQKVNLGNARRSGNVLTWQTAQADLQLTFGGHYLKLEIPLKGGWQPPNGQFAFPIGLTGLTRNGGVILADGVPVMRVRSPVVYDAGNPEDIRPIAHDFVRAAGQWYAVFTLPSLSGMTSPVIDPTLDLQPNGAGLDTWLNQSNVNRNYGTSTVMYAGYNGSGNRMRSLLQFDISSMPGGATITGATVSLQCDWADSSTSLDLSFHRALTQWYEGLQSAGTPGAGEDASTWSYRNYNGSVAWGAAGGQSGTDYAASATAAMAVAGAGAYSRDGLTADVEAWYEGTASNYGWVLLGVESGGANTYKSFRTSDFGTAAQRPKLSIEYTLPVTPQSVSGSVSFAGVSLKRPAKNFTGSMSSAGSMIKRPQIIKIGTLTSAGAVVKKTTRLLTGALSSAGGLILSTGKKLLGSLASSGAVSWVRGYVVSLAGTLVSAGEAIRQARKALAGSLGSEGTLGTIRTFLRTLTGTLTSSGAANTAMIFGRALSGALTSAGQVVREARTNLSGSLGSAGELLKQASINLAGALTSSGVVSTVRVYLRSLSGAMTSAGDLAKATGKNLAGSLESAGTIIKRIYRELAGELTSGGALSSLRAYFMALAGTLSSAGTLIKRTGINLAGSLANAGSVVKKTTRLLTGTLSGTGLLTTLFRIILPTPAKRTLVVANEARTFEVPAESRVLAVEAEDRTYYVSTEETD